MVRRFLIVDDNSEDRRIIQDWLETSNQDFELVECDSVEEGLRRYHQEDFHCVLLDYNFPQSSAIEFLENAFKNREEIIRSPVIVITGQSDDEIAATCIRAGATDYINKDRLTDPGHVAAKIVNRVVTEHSQIKEIARSRAAEKLMTSSLAKKVEELRLAKLSADSANVSKSAFLANMSHEIRSPLTSILGFTQLLRDMPHESNEIKEYLRTIEGNAEHLLSVINEILDFSKVEAGKVSLSVSKFNIQDLLNEVIDNFRRPAAAKNVALRAFIHQDFPNLIVSDPTRVRQIITNLISNAVKFTQAGEVIVIARFNPSESDQPQDSVSIVVSDTGEGINKIDASKLFKRFAQANESISPKFGGTGLGLVLSRKLADILGGKLELVSSEPAIGSLFKLDLPIEIKNVSFDQLPNKNEVAPKKECLNGIKILVVDDSPDNQLLFRMMLGKLGAEVVALSDGMAAVENASRLRPDVVLMDVQMPYLDGHRAARELRKRGFDTPIIGITAHALAEDQTKSVRAGFNAQLTKPVDRAALVEAILNFSGPLAGVDPFA